MHRMNAGAIALFCLALSLFGCAPVQVGPIRYGVGAQFDKAKYKRVGLLVARMGNQNGFPFHHMPDITRQTNYADRRGGPPSLGWSSDDTDTAVYIEEEARLRDLFPKYPIVSCGSSSSTWLPKISSCAKLFKNITPQLSNHLSELLARKGYEVVDLRKTAAAWDRPISEMTVDEILGRSRGIVDAVFIFHYTDRGEFSYTVGSQVGPHPVSGSGTGFTSINYSGAMFDVATRESIVSFHNGNHPPMNDAVMAHDPEILADPVQKKKVLKSQDDYDPEVDDYTETSFTEDEVVEYVAKYICYGVKWSGHHWLAMDHEWKGLDAIVP
jgi:hypothetical protein